MCAALFAVWAFNQPGQPATVVVACVLIGISAGVYPVLLELSTEEQLMACPN